MIVVALGALCDLVLPEQSSVGPGGLSFDVSEFAVLDDGRRITLHAERGWTEWPRRAVPADEPLDPWEHTSREDIVRTTLAVVLPDDDDDPDDHPYEWLAGLLDKHGIRASAAELRSLPYTRRVELSVGAAARPRLSVVLCPRQPVRGAVLDHCRTSAPQRTVGSWVS